MRALLSAAELAACVKITNTAIATRPTAPVLAGVLLGAEGGQTLTLTTFDYDTVANARCGAFVSDGRAVLVSHRLLANVLATVKTGEISLDDGDGALVVTAGRAVWTLPLMRIEDYPSLPEPGEQFATIDGGEFADAVERVATAAADSPPQNLDNIYLGIRDGELALAGCNRFRLHVADVKADVESGAGSFVLIPARRLQAMTRHLGVGTVSVRRSDGLFTLSSANAAISTRMTEPEGGRWLAYQGLLVDAEDPAKVKASVTTDRDQLLGALRQVAGFADEAGKGARHISMMFARHGELSIAAGTAAEGGATTIVDTEHDGPSIRVTVNVAYIAEAVDILTSPAARLTFQDPKRPIGVGSEGQPVTAVVVPVAGTGSAGAWLDDEVLHGE